MAIYYEPENLSPSTSPTKVGVKIKKSRDGVTEDWSPWLSDSTRQDMKTQPRKPRVLRPEIKSRTELIESIKRGERPKWVPSPALEALLTKYNHTTSGEQDQVLPHGNSTVSDIDAVSLEDEDVHTTKNQETNCPSRDTTPEEIERPRSALHSGDFFQRNTELKLPLVQTSINAHSTSPPRDLLCSQPATTSWYAPAVPSFTHPTTGPSAGRGAGSVSSRPRTPSLGSSLTQSFIFRHPTSPLVHAASNSDLEPPAGASCIPQSPGPERTNRRRTLPPDEFDSFSLHSTSGGGPTIYNRPFLSLRRESSRPYQAHQPRRSLTSLSSDHSPTSPGKPAMQRPRRPSCLSDHSPLQHASMVGSFEESILRGRMSTAPSKPLDFVARIGVLGRGDCKPHLRCPAHVTVPFPAVFYNYPTVGTRSFADDTPSPYVGTIDLEQSLKPAEAKRPPKHHRSPPDDQDTSMRDINSPENPQIGLAIDRRRREGRPNRSASPKRPFGGCYRVPQQGQLQIVIKNPNKTAVKLYLVPYNLDGMEAGTKTFVRQRSFSAGPIVERPLTENPKTVSCDPLQHKSILRYLIHLKFCCPSKGRYYLYDNIRVVFANRVPDGKESLRNEVQLPEPRYSSYRPLREPSMGSAGAKLMADRALTRRGSRFAVHSANFDAMDGLIFNGPSATSAVKSLGAAHSEAIPFHLPPRLKVSGPDFQGASRHPNTASMVGVPASLPQHADVGLNLESTLQEPIERVISPKPGFISSTCTRASPVPWKASVVSNSSLDHHLLSRTVSPTAKDCSEGLLSRELRSMDTAKPKETDA